MRKTVWVELRDVLVAGVVGGVAAVLLELAGCPRGVAVGFGVLVAFTAYVYAKIERLLRHIYCC